MRRTSPSYSTGFRTRSARAAAPRTARTRTSAIGAKRTRCVQIFYLQLQSSNSILCTAIFTLEFQHYVYFIRYVNFNIVLQYSIFNFNIIFTSTLYQLQNMYFNFNTANFNYTITSTSTCVLQRRRTRIRVRRTRIFPRR
jgi:hypothetical protein